MEIKKQLIYLDNNATTQINKRVLDEIMPFLTNEFANTNSTHQIGILLMKLSSPQEFKSLI